MEKLDLTWLLPHDRRSPAQECSPLVSMIEHVGGHVIDVFRRKLVAECRHAALAVRDLGLDGSNIVATSQILLQLSLLDLLLTHDIVVASCVARCAICTKDRLTILEVCSQGWSAAHHSS